MFSQRTSESDVQCLLQIYSVSCSWVRHGREEAAETMDMSVVSRKLEKETKSSVRGTVNGRIPRMLLIQVTDVL